MPLLRRVWHPMGHAVEIATGSAEVVSTAAHLWNEFPPLSEAPPIRIRVEISRQKAPSSSPVKTQCHGNLLTVTQRPGNFAVADLQSGEGLIYLAPDVARNRPWFAYHFLEPVTYMLLGAQHFTMIHAACVARNGSAALFCGPSGAGKTCLAYACARNGWSFVSGDAAHLRRDSVEPLVIGRPSSLRLRSSASELFPELRGHPAIERPNGKCDFELDPRQLGLRGSHEERVSLVVFLNRVPHRRPEVERVSADEARSLLSEWICFGGESIRWKQRMTLERLLAQRLARLTYSDPFAAEEVLRRELDQPPSDEASGRRTQKQAPRETPFSTHRSPP